MNWELIGTIMSVVGIPALGALWGLIEHRRSKRDEVQHNFNKLILNHMDKTGKVLAINATITLEGPTSNTLDELSEAVKGYNSFREDVDRFQREQTLDALHPRKGGKHNG